MTAQRSVSRPLDGVTIEVPETLPPAVAVECARVLGWFGVTVDRADFDIDSGPPQATETAPMHVPGLPAGTLEYFWGALAAARIMGDGRGTVPTKEQALGELLLPAKLSRGSWRRPPEPHPVTDGGFVCADVAAPDDAEVFDRFAATTADRSLNAESFAAEAQVWRLPVTPYRAPDATLRRPDLGGPCVAGRGPSAGFEPPALGPPPVVVDLTAMWAGPLCTRLLVDAGAVVHKIEPACRPDGTRLDQHGLHAALNGGKNHHDLDLREPDQRASFEALVAEADLVIDSFSPRVRPNLGITRAELLVVNPDVMTLSLPAFAAGTPERAWVAYGTGIHAVSGLGWTNAGPCAPAVTYPDPVAGAVACSTATAMLAGRARGWRQGAHVEVPLATAIVPLLTKCDEQGAALHEPLDHAALQALGVLV